MSVVTRPKIFVHVSKRFGDVAILADVRFDIHANEFLCIVGPTGCGKTTLANVVAGLMPPTRGAVAIDGRPVDPRRVNVSFVFQEPSCLPWLTVEDNVRLGLEIRGVAGASAARRVREVIDLVALGGFERYYPSQISGGMKQRVAIARALATDPDLLIMDEPFAHLDAQTRCFMQLEVMRIRERLKTTVLFVSNDFEEAALLADRVLVLSRLPARVVGEVTVDLPREGRRQTEPVLLALRRRIAGMCEAALG